MTLNGVRTALAGVLATVPGIGRVHDYLRVVLNESERKDFLLSGGRLHSWMVTLSDDEPYRENRAPSNCARADVVLSVHGYYAVADLDASEKAFTTVLDAALATLRENKSLSGTVIEAGPAAVREFGHRMYANVACHYVRLDVPIRAQVEG